MKQNLGSAGPSHFSLGVGGAGAVGVLDQPCQGVGLGGARARPCVGCLGPSGGGEGQTILVVHADGFILGLGSEVGCPVSRLACLVVCPS